MVFDQVAETYHNEIMFNLFLWLSHIPLLVGWGLHGNLLDLYYSQVILNILLRGMTQASTLQVYWPNDMVRGRRVTLHCFAIQCWVASVRMLIV